MHTDYTGKGFDQLLDVINKIKKNPDDRRIILSAWNPSDLKKMALPPCHMFSQVSLLHKFIFLLFYMHSIVRLSFFYFYGKLFARRSN